jgi:hypothetical protein
MTGSYSRTSRTTARTFFEALKYLAGKKKPAEDEE